MTLWCLSAPLWLESAPLWCHSAQCAVTVLHCGDSVPDCGVTMLSLVSKCSTVVSQAPLRCHSAQLCHLAPQRSHSSLIGCHIAPLR